MTVNRDTARRYSARARAAVLVLAVGACAAAALPLPFLKPQPTTAAISTEAPAATSAAAEADQEPPIDLVLANSVLWQVGPPPPEEAAPEPTAVATTAPTTPEPAKPATPAITPGGWRYIGNIMGPRGMHALLEREGRQKLVRAGDRLEGSRIVAVDSLSVTIDDGQGPRELKLAERTSRWSDIPIATPARPATAPGRVNTPNIPNVPGMLQSRSGQVTRPTSTPPPRQYSTELTDEERQRYELEKVDYAVMRERALEAGEELPPETADGGKR